MATQNKVSTEEMLAEKLRLMEAQQRELIKTAEHQERHHAVAEYERDGVTHFSILGAQDNPLNSDTVNRDHVENPRSFLTLGTITTLSSDRGQKQVWWQYVIVKVPPHGMAL